MDDWKLLPRPEHLSELYFTDYRQMAVPTDTNAPQTVTFTVRNLEYQTITYHYTLAAISEGGLKERPLSSGSFALAHNHSRVISKAVVLPLGAGQLGVKVSLRYKSMDAHDSVSKLRKQSIHYWTTSTYTPVADEENGEGV